MDDAIRRRALRSAAKVAFGATLCWGVTLSGCGGKSVGDDDEVDGEPTVSSEGTKVEPPDAGSGLACTPPLGPVDPNVVSTWDASIYACCTDYIHGRLSSEPNPAVQGAVLAADPSSVNCCRYVNVAYYSLRTEFGDEEFPYEANQACCSLDVLPEGEYLGPFCTPWGPPVPPALDAELEAAA